MSATCSRVLSALLMFGGMAVGQVASLPPKHFKSATPIELRSVTRVQLSHNSPDAIRQELLDTNTISVIATGTDLTGQELATMVIAPDPADSEVWLYQVGDSDRAWDLFGSKVKLYAQG